MVVILAAPFRVLLALMVRAPVKVNVAVEALSMYVVAVAVFARVSELNLLFALLLVMVELPVPLKVVQQDPMSMDEPDENVQLPLTSILPP